MQYPNPSFYVASGPFIVEDGKLLLVKEKKGDIITPWYLPGGKFEEQDTTLEENAKREVREELGVEIEIIKPLRPFIRRLGEKGNFLLVAFVAKRAGEIKPGTDIVEWGWFDINNLPKDCEDSIYKFVEDYKSMI